MTALKELQGNACKSTLTELYDSREVLQCCAVILAEFLSTKFDSNMYFKSHTNTTMEDMLKAQKDFMLNMYVFQVAVFLSGYRRGMWCSSSANKQVLQATCSNALIFIPTADPVTEQNIIIIISQTTF
jgi:hypothetical protein